jgi:hypothetical protein
MTTRRELLAGALSAAAATATGGLVAAAAGSPAAAAGPFGGYADATFVRTAGLADPAWTSFRSHNFPDRHLRHANLQLRIDVLGSGSSATARADATFQVGY